MSAKLRALGRVSLAGAWLSVASVIVGGGSSPAAGASLPETSLGKAIPHRVVAPMLACGGCDHQAIRLYYVGLRAQGETFEVTFDPRVRAAIWSVTDPWALQDGSASQMANVGTALTVILPDGPDAYAPVHSPDVGLCDSLLSAAGYPSGAEPRLTIPLDIRERDRLTASIIAALKKQWSGCGISPEVREWPAAEFAALLGIGDSNAFLTSVDAHAAEPYGLLERLFGLGSPYNFTNVEPIPQSHSMPVTFVPADAGIVTPLTSTLSCEIAGEKSESEGGCACDGTS